MNKIKTSSISDFISSDETDGLVGLGWDSSSRRTRTPTENKTSQIANCPIRFSVVWFAKENKKKKIKTKTKFLDEQRHGSYTCSGSRSGGGRPAEILIQTHTIFIDFI